MISNEYFINKVNESIRQTKSLVNSDYHRLKYHIVPQVGLINDPNGFIQINGEYHLFYQFHPFGPIHGLKCWGHKKSRNLVYWDDLPVALVPSEPYETHGCYSGSAVNDHGVLTLIYTGNVKDEKGNRETYQCLATTKDGISFSKYTKNPVIPHQPQGYTSHFRDPKVWKKDDEWYMVIGAQSIQKEGRVLLFRSSNLKNWVLIGEVTGSNLNHLGDFGYMWECPDFFELDGKDVLLACPQGVQPHGEKYNNIYQSGYMIGKIDYKSGRMKHEEFTELDRGFEFYAPQTTIDDLGRRILIAWMGLPDMDEHPTKDFGWIHALTLPRVLKRIGNKLYQSPVEELKELRSDEVVYCDILINNEEIELDNIEGDVFELLVEFELVDATAFGIKLRCSEDEKQHTLLCYDVNSNRFELNRDRSGKGYDGIRRCSLELKTTLTLHVFSDTSSLEIFLNEGEEVFTSRIYPDSRSKGIKLFAQNGIVKINRITKWNLNSIEIRGGFNDGKKCYY